MNALAAVLMIATSIACTFVGAFAVSFGCLLIAVGFIALAEANA